MECPLSSANKVLKEMHYLGAVRRGIAWGDEFGVLVLASPPTSRHLPTDWIELTRWCLVGYRNGGSKQWSRVSRWISYRLPEVTTVVSYSDPSQGHTGALYRACNWKWAPTWIRLVPPPTGNGNWGGRGVQSPKDRWIFEIKSDSRRGSILSLEPSYKRRFPWAVYPEADIRLFHKGGEWPK